MKARKTRRTNGAKNPHAKPESGMVACPDCGRTVPVKAGVCAFCSCPISDASDASNEMETGDERSPSRGAGHELRRSGSAESNSRQYRRSIWDVQFGLKAKLILIILLWVPILWFQRQEKLKEEEAAKTAAEQKKAEKQRQSEVNYFGTSWANDKPKSSSPAGHLFVGTKLYSPGTGELFGVVTKIEWGRVEVAKAESVSTDSYGAHGYAVWYDRSYITKNFEAK